MVKSHSLSFSLFLFFLSHWAVALCLKCLDCQAISKEVLYQCYLKVRSPSHPTPSQGFHTFTFWLPFIEVSPSVLGSVCVQSLEIFLPSVWVEVPEQFFHSVKASNGLIQSFCRKSWVSHWWRMKGYPLRQTQNRLKNACGKWTTFLEKHSP